MAARLTVVRLCTALWPLAARMQAHARHFTASSAHLVRRPTFDGPWPPKRPPNAYALFVMDTVRSAGMTDTSGVDRMKKIGEMWKSLSQAEKDTYKAKYEEEKKAYEKEMAEFMQGLGRKKEQEAYLVSLAEYRAKRRAYLKKFRLKKLGLLKPNKVLGYQLFLGEQLRNVSGATELIKEIPSRWKALTDEEREHYKKVAEEKYATKLAEYEERVDKARKEGVDIPEQPDVKEKSKMKSTTSKKSTSLGGRTKLTAKRRKNTVKKTATKVTVPKKTKKSSDVISANQYDGDDDEEWFSSDDED